MAIWYIPTTTVSILRGTTETEYGDIVPSDTKVYTNIPASIAEYSASVLTSDTRDEIINRFAGLVPNGTDVHEDDILLDEHYGRKFIVLAVADPQPMGPFKTAPVSVMLRYLET